MRVIVSDRSVIIDLAKVRLIKAAFRLPHRFTITNVMYEDELLDLGDYHREDLVGAGLDISVLDGHGVALAFKYGMEYQKLTPNDCFALALAKTTEGAILLTGDRRLGIVASENDVEARGLLWLCDDMNDHGTVDHRVLHDALVALSEDPSVHLPAAELRKRIQRLLERL